jgi:catechol-2,3-dioxygenase
LVNEESFDAAGQANWACNAGHTRSRAAARLLHARRWLEHRCQREGPRDPGDQAGARGDRARAWRAAGWRAARLQVAPGSDLGELAARLSKAGIKSERRSGITPGIAQAIVFTDPKGTIVEIFSDYAFAKDDDNYTGVMPRKLGHVAFHTPDVAATVKFYCDVLGFKVSDWRSDFFAFLRCSRDHHTINLLQADNANIHHLAFELCDEAEINRACDFLARKNIKLFWGPIRHLIGHNIAIYHKNPDGITVEFFTDLDLMFDEELGYFEPRPWHQDRPQRPKVWGDDTPTNYWGPGHPHDMPGPKK